MKDKISEILVKYYYVDWANIDECIKTIKEELDKVCVLKEDLPDEKELEILIDNEIGEWETAKQEIDSVEDISYYLAKAIAKRIRGEK